MNNDRINEISARCEAAESFGLETLDERTKNLTVGLLGMHENGTMQVSKKFLHTIRAYMVELLECRKEEIPFLLAELDRLTEAQRWIAVEERLPEPWERVLTYNGEFNEVHLAWVNGVGRWADCLGMFAPNRITHWMPLPAAPKGE